MLRFQSTIDFQVRDEDVLLGQLTDLANHTGQDHLPALATTILRMLTIDRTPNGILYLTSDLQGTVYWTPDQPIGWPMGMVIAQWTLVYDHGGEVTAL